MSIPYYKGNWNQAKPISASYIDYPFQSDGDSNTKVYHLICQVNRDAYTPLALDTTMTNATTANVSSLPWSGDANAYHVGDSTPRSIGGGVVEFERTFAKIPEARANRASGSTAYSFPGIVGSTEGATNSNVTAFSQNTTARTTTLTVGTSLNVGDFCFARLVTTDSVTTLLMGQYRAALTGTNSTHVVVSRLASLTNFVSGTVSELLTPPRGQKSLEVGTVADSSYYLPGVTANITTPLDVETSPVFSPLDIETGETSGVLSEKTFPTNVEYSADAANNEIITISSIVAPWMGNIIEKRDTKTKAL